MLDCVRFVSKHEARGVLLDQLEEVVRIIIANGGSLQSIVVVPASGDGESSGEVWGMLREEPTLQELGIKFFSGNPMQLGQLVRGLQNPVVIFVDDFAGTGNQFCKAYVAWSAMLHMHQPVTYFVACVMCSPAIAKVGGVGVIPIPGIEHSANEMFKAACERTCGFEGYHALMSYAEELHSKLPLGFNGMGTMIVVYRNSSNNMSFLLRGSMGQRIWFGLFPRRDQLTPPVGF